MLLGHILLGIGLVCHFEITMNLLTVIYCATVNMPPFYSLCLYVFRSFIKDNPLVSFSAWCAQNLYLSLLDSSNRIKCYTNYPLVDLTNRFQILIPMPWIPHAEMCALNWSTIVFQRTICCILKHV